MHLTLTVYKNQCGEPRCGRSGPAGWWNHRPAERCVSRHWSASAHFAPPDVSWHYTDYN